VVADVLELFLANVRNPEERRPDVRAQLAANERRGRTSGDLLSTHGDRLLTAFDAVINYSRERVETEIRDLPNGTYHASDVLEGDGVTEDDVPIEVTVTVDGAALDVDFAGTAAQVAGNVNAPLAVAESAVYYVVRCVTDPDVPPNAGCYEPISVSAPNGSLLNPDPPAAVVGGNVETSQRVTDVVFDALADAAPDRVPAAGQGTMNNLIVGGTGFTLLRDHRRRRGGANPASDGLSGVQVGMTNTENTPSRPWKPVPAPGDDVRPPRGQRRGGTLPRRRRLIRELRLEADATVSLLTERRRVAPPGRAGAKTGRQG